MDGNQNITKEDILFIRSVFKEIRENLMPFMKERNFQLSNPQLFTFLSYSPTALAIASDGTVDEKEMAALEKISRGVNVNSMVNLDLMQRMALAQEPEDCILNEEFNIRAGSELLNLCRNMEKYEQNFINATKALLKFDHDPTREDSMTKSFVKMMDTIIESNVSENKEEEKEKLKAIQKKMGIN